MGLAGKGNRARGLQEGSLPGPRKGKGKGRREGRAVGSSGVRMSERREWGATKMHLDTSSVDLDDLFLKALVGSLKVLKPGEGCDQFGGEKGKGLGRNPNERR